MGTTDIDEQQDADMRDEDVGDTGRRRAWRCSEAKMRHGTRLRDAEDSNRVLWLGSRDCHVRGHKGRGDSSEAASHGRDALPRVKTLNPELACDLQPGCDLDNTKSWMGKRESQRESIAILSRVHHSVSKQRATRPLTRDLDWCGNRIP